MATGDADVRTLQAEVRTLAWRMTSGDADVRTLAWRMAYGDEELRTLQAEVRTFQPGMRPTRNADLPLDDPVCGRPSGPPYILARCLHPTSCERSELSGEFNGTEFLYYYIYVSGLTSCRKCFHVILNIRSIRLALICNTTHMYIYISRRREREKEIVELAKQLKNECVDFLNVELGIENELTNVVNQTLLLKATSG